MPTLQSVIEHILKKKSIVEYLEKKGYQPFKSLTGGKLSYLCPLPGHTETRPSFFVWTNSEYENFYCFGCQRNYNIIHLVAYMENLTVKEATQKLAEGLSFTVDDDINMTIERIHKQNKLSTLLKDDLSIQMLDISDKCKKFLTWTKNNPAEIALIDKFWNKIDSYLLNCDFDQFNNISKNLEIVLEDRRKAYAESDENRV